MELKQQSLFVFLRNLIDNVLCLAWPRARFGFATTVLAGSSCSPGFRDTARRTAFRRFLRVRALDELPPHRARALPEAPPRCSAAARAAKRANFGGHRAAVE
eukprot:7073149-Pyramimonas_sp.AAC.1